VGGIIRKTFATLFTRSEIMTKNEKLVWECIINRMKESEESIAMIEKELGIKFIEKHEVRVIPLSQKKDKRHHSKTIPDDVADIKLIIINTQTDASVFLEKRTSLKKEIVLLFKFTGGEFSDRDKT
jgi:hypothetical protein